MIATPGWCLLSNRLGRRPILITGLLGSSLSLVLFGRSQSFIEAAITRGLGGLLNGNLPICRTYIGELATQTQSDLSKLFSVFGFALSMGFMGKSVEAKPYMS
jgi:MFS family permease